METLEQYISEVTGKLIEAQAKSITIQIADSKEEDFVALRISGNDTTDDTEYKHSQDKGDLAGYFSKLFCLNPSVKICIKYITDEEYFELNTDDVKDVFIGMKLDDEEVIENLAEMIEENIGEDK